MSLDLIGDVNWLSVIAATLAYFALGALWWAPKVFGDAWVRSSGVEIPEDAGPQLSFYVIPFLGCLAASIVLAMLAEATGSTTIGNGVVLGLLAGVAFGFGTVAASTAADDRPSMSTWLAIVGGYHLVGLVIAGAIVSAW